MTPSTQEAARLGHIEALAQQGPAGVKVLMGQLTERSWWVRRSVIGALARMGETAVDALCDVLAQQRDDETRLAAAVDALVQSHGDVERALERLAQHPLPAVLCDVAQILGRRRSLAAIPLLSRLVRHSDDNVSVAALEALGHTGGRTAVPAVIEAARSGNFFRTFPAIDILGRSGEWEAVEPLLTLLNDPIYTSEVIRALGRTGDARAVKALIDLLHKPGDSLLRTVALALSDAHDVQVTRWGAVSGVGRQMRAAQLPHPLGRRLTRSLAGTHTSEKVAIARVLGWVGGEEAITQLLEMLREPGEIAAAAAAALTELDRGVDGQLREAVLKGSSEQRLAVLPLLARRKEGLPEILQCLTDPQPSVRAAACDALARLGDVSAVPQVFPLLEDEDLKVAQAALGAIQSLGSPQTEALTLDAATSPKTRVRRAALRIIAYYGYPRGLDVLLAAASDPDEKIRDAALYGLPFLEDPRATQALLGAAQHPSAKTRAAAMRALGMETPAAAIGATLRQGLTDEDAWVRYYAVQSLGRTRDAQAVPHILPLMEDLHGQVRVAVLDALALLKTPAALDALRAATTSSDADMQRAAYLGLGVTKLPSSFDVLVKGFSSDEAATRLVVLSALAEFDRPDVLSLLSRAANDPDENVRNAAVGFLSARSGPGATEQLAALVAHSPLRELVLSSLATPAQGRIEGIVAALQSADETSAALLLGVLGRMEGPEAVQAILAVLAGSGVYARRAAAHTVASWGTSLAHDALRKSAHEDSDPEVRRLCSLSLVA